MIKDTILRMLKKTVIVTVAIVAFLAIVVFIYMQQPTFGKGAAGERLAMVKKSGNYKNGSFQNIHNTPTLTEGYNTIDVILELLFKKNKRRYPSDIIPSMKTDLLHLPAGQDILVWFGHSSYFIQVDGKRILVDPIFSGNASPIPGTTRSFKGTDKYTVDDLPTIDYLLISHDHYDHTDFETLKKLKPKIKKVVCGLGVGAHFEYWGYSADAIIEKDWDQEVEAGDGFIIRTVTARHFSGRGFSRNNTLWMSYLLITPSMKIYLGGDGGYDTHFAKIGDQFGPIDIAILENGQYDTKWKYIHMMPKQVLQAAKDLRARRLFPGHSSKFALANHAWDEPLVRVTELNKTFNIPLITPMIGAPVNLKDERQKFNQWWVGVE